MFYFYDIIYLLREGNIMIIIEFMRNGVGNYIEVTKENLQEQVKIFTDDLINGTVDYFHVFYN